MLARTIVTTDYHTAEGPFRIVADPPVPIDGSTDAARRAWATEDPAVQAVGAVLHRTGEHTFTIDPHDPLVPGFVLR